MKNKSRPQPIEFRRSKLNLALIIMGVGMLIALVWNAVQGWGLGKDYPDNTFLFLPNIRFSDFTDVIVYAHFDNPYLDPYAVYLPFAWAFIRLFSAVPVFFSLTAFLFISLGGLFILLFRVLAGTVPSPWKRCFVSLLFLALSYPVLVSVDRGNLEILLVAFIAAALFFFSRRQYGWGTLCLIGVINFKLYPALFLLLLLRQRRLELIAAAAVVFLVAVFVSLYALGLPLNTGFEFYGRDLLFFTRAYVSENYALEGSASLWNAYKVILISAAHFGLIAPVDFSFDGRFIGISSTIYSACTALLSLILAIYVCLVEKEFLRCAIVLLLDLSIATPFGADYRLLYANIALVLLILLPTRRRHDWLALVLLALAMVPKKEIILTYLGRTETGFADVSIQVLLNPLLILGALLLLLYNSRAAFDWHWSQLRVRRLLRAIRPEARRSPSPEAS